MVITQAVNRIFWRFGGNGNNKPFPVNEQDIEAYNSIKDFVKKTNQQQLEENQKFAKLFMYLYTRILEQSGTTIFDINARREIYEILEKPLWQLIEEFQRSLNDSERYELVDSLGLSKEHPATLSEERREQDSQKLFEASRETENMKKLIGEAWDFKSANELAEAEIIQAINYQ